MMSRYYQIILNSLLFCLGRIKPFCGPLKVQIEVTHRCNSRCKSCNFWQKKVKDEMTKDEFLPVIEGLHRLGSRRIGFGGGETLIFDGIFDLIKYAKKLDMVTSIGTNALLLERYCSEISESGLDIIEISLDSGKEVHNINRGREDAFDKVIRGDNNICLLYIDDLIEVFNLILEKEISKNQIFISAPSNSIKLSDFVNYVAEYLGVKKPNLHLPVWPLWLLAILFEKMGQILKIPPPLYRARINFFLDNQIFDISKAYNLLDFKQRSR